MGYLIRVCRKILRKIFVTAIFSFPDQAISELPNHICNNKLHVTDVNCLTYREVSDTGWILKRIRHVTKWVIVIYFNVGKNKFFCELWLEAGFGYSTLSTKLRRPLLLDWSRIPSISCSFPKPWVRLPPHGLNTVFFPTGLRWVLKWTKAHHSKKLVFQIFF